MTSSIKIAEYKYVVTNKANVDGLYEIVGKKVFNIKRECPGNLSDFMVKYNLVADNNSFLVTFWVEIFLKNGVKSGKVSENPGKTPQDIVKEMVYGPNRGDMSKSRNRDYFSAPVNTKNYYLNNFPSCAGMLIETV